MRFHQLTVCAFGPFADTETVDFDALSADGLFLMRGPTGAGKTSVLDALTFALYGDVPGERSSDRLKSQHAPPERTPYVELEFSSGEQRYRVRRQPTYYRPAKRAGASPQREGSALVIHRWDHSEWKPVPTARVAEGDVELEQIIGLKMHEFTKVILLPQGAFAKLLHASNEERRGILEQLFDTGTFERLENHLWEQMRQAESELKDIDARIQAHTAAVRSAAESLLGEHFEDLAETPVEELATVVTEQARAQQQVLESAEQTAQTAMKRAAGHAEALSAARAELLRWAEHAQRRDQLEDQRSSVDRARRGIEEHRAAVSLRDWLDAAEQAERASKQAREHAAHTAETARRELAAQDQIAVGSLIPGEALDAASLEEMLTQLVQWQARLTDQDAAEAEARHAQVLAGIRAAEDSATQSQARCQELTEELQAQQLDLEDKRSRLSDPEGLQARRDALHRELEVVRRRSELITQRESVKANLQDLEAEMTRRGHAAESAQHSYRGTAEAYLRSQAHELAQTLEPGHPCLVCGSTEHPDPLISTAETVTREQVGSAAEDLHRARAALEKVRAEHAAATESLTGILESLGEHREATAKQIRALQQRAEEHLSTAETAQTEQRALRDTVEALTAAVARTQQQHTAALHQGGQYSAEAIRLTTEAEALQHKIEKLRAGYSSIADRRTALTELETVLRVAQGAAQHVDTAAAQVHRSRSDADQQLQKSIFGTVEEVKEAVRTDDELEPLRHSVTQFEQAAQQLHFDAQTEQVRAGARRAENDEETPAEETVTHAQLTAEDTRADHQEKQRQLTAFTARCVALTETTATLDAALQQRAEQTLELMRRSELAKTVNGQGENALRMRLTTFVLAARLERVAEAATHHLRAMTDGRYQLLLDAERAGRGLRGLDLKVHDEYAEQQRPAESLSGGETFMTSLAMALGLAEVVQSEAGGIGMESLFIDEGFGSLDDHALEAVMQALHTLQGEGRRIGVVSHVSDMHQQIPVQLRIEKTRTGSTLRMELPV